MGVSREVEKYAIPEGHFDTVFVIIIVVILTFILI